jgi:ferredoxin
MSEAGQGRSGAKLSWDDIMTIYAGLKAKWRKAGRLSRIPVVGDLLINKHFDKAADANWMVPVGEAIERGQSSAIPFDVLKPILEKASYIHRMNRCPCRDGYGCTQYPHDIGCLIMGPAARDIRPEFGGRVSVAEALGHAQNAVSSGLVPLIVHAESDAQLFGIEYRRMLAICFCCDCCCDIRMGLRLGPEVFWDNVHRLPGLRVEVSDDCTLCGDCVGVCFRADVITMGQNKVQISEKCVGCGQCAEACPAGAISFQMEEGSDLVGHLLHQIADRTEI